MEIIFSIFFPEESDLKKPAEIIADHLVKWLKEKSLHLTLQAVGCDSTNVNTGWAGGVIQWVEKKLSMKLVWIVCDLHTGELGLRRLIKFLDGSTQSNNQWSGPLGKLLNNATDLEINPGYMKVCESAPPLIYLSPDIIKDLSTDQSYAYQIVTSIKTGVLPKRLSLLEIGPVCHSRWLTTALRFCRIWVSKHGIGENLNKLRLIVEYIVGVYVPNWFNIKIKLGGGTNQLT